jgi:tRNA (cmo5U34)-methyltransferase
MLLMKTENVREHFRVQVPNYEGLMRRLIPYYDNQRDLMLALIPFERSAPLRILDLGCGPGLMAARILTEFPNAQLTLFDLTSEMIEACRSRFEGNDRVTYQPGDFRTDDFGSGYDVIVASLSLHHLMLSERPAFARRAIKSLIPGGHLITAEVIVDRSPEVRERQYELWRRHMVEQGEDGNVWYEKHLAKDHPVETSAWLLMLSEAGFVSAGCFWRYLNFAIISARRPAV